MGAYIETIEKAMVYFPIVAAVFTLPYVIFQYKKYGAIPFIRSLIIYSFVLYLMSAYFLAIMPLPAVEEVAAMRGDTMQLRPFTFINDIMKQNVEQSGGSYSIVDILESSSFLQAAFNVLMFLPLGIYLHYYFERNWYQTLLISFGMSLFFELTQLSGLYGIYPRPYRLFDVDDLMINSLGGMIGYLITPIFMKILPSRAKINEIAYKHGEHVSFMRRLFAWGFDMVALLFVSAFISLALDSLPHCSAEMDRIAGYIAAILFCFVAVPMLTGGTTFGRALMAMRIARIDNKPPRIYQYLVRAILMYLIVLPTPWYILSGTIATSDDTLISLIVVCSIVSAFIFAVFVLESFGQLFGRNKDYIFCRISGTKDVSCVERPRLHRPTARASHGIDR